MKYTILFTLLFLVFGCFNKPLVEYDIVISNVNLIDGTGSPLQREVTIGIKDGKILEIDTHSIKHALNIIEKFSVYHLNLEIQKKISYADIFAPKSKSKNNPL